MAKGKYEYWLTSEGLLKLEAWARDGLIDEQIASNIGIVTSTLYDWKKKYTEITEVLKKGKEVVDIQVENALLKRALGYKYTEITRERMIDSEQKKRHGGESELTEQEWKLAMKYFDGCCCYCGKKMEKSTKDHIRPLKKGGSMTRNNIIPCCQNCNSSRKDNEMTQWYQTQVFYSKERLNKIQDYLRFIEDNGDLEKDKLVVTKEVEKEIVPDITAQIFWLKNRKSKEWRDKQNIEHNGGVDVKNVYNNMSEEELIELAKKYEKINAP